MSNNNNSNPTTPTKPSKATAVASSPVTPQSQGRRRAKKRWFAQRDSIERRMKPGRPGTPRYQRYLNRCFLLDLQEEVTGRRSVSSSVETEIETRFVNVFGRGAVGDEVVEHDLVELEESFFSDVTCDADARAKWAPFVSVDLDEQDDLLASLGSSLPSTPPREGLVRPHGVASKYWEPLRRCQRNVHYWDYVCRLEVYLTHYLHLIGGLDDRSTSSLQSMVDAARFVEPDVAVPYQMALVLDGANRLPAWTLVLESSFHRLLCHALCSYYKVCSESVTVDKVRHTYVRIGKPISSLPADFYPSMPKMSLSAYLMKHMDVSDMTD